MDDEQLDELKDSMRWAKIELILVILVLAVSMLFFALCDSTDAQEIGDPEYWQVERVDTVTSCREGYSGGYVFDQIDEQYGGCLYVQANDTLWMPARTILDTTWTRIPGRWECRVDTVGAQILRSIVDWVDPMGRRHSDSIYEPGGCIDVYDTTCTPREPVYLTPEERAILRDAIADQRRKIECRGGIIKGDSVIYQGEATAYRLLDRRFYSGGPGDIDTSDIRATWQGSVSRIVDSMLLGDVYGPPMYRGKK